MISSIKDTFGFSICDSSLTYLGIRLAHALRSMYNATYPQVFPNIRQWLQLWSTSPMCLLGRVTATNMSILPKLLLFFRALPIYVSHQTIETIQKGSK